MPQQASQAGRVRTLPLAPLTVPVVPTPTCLLPHPATPCPAVAAIDVTLRLAADGALHLCYSLSGQLGALRIPSPCPPAFTDGLWQHTCLEAFIGAPDRPAYREFNFAPSGAWAVYDFEAYRARNLAYQPVEMPHIELTHDTDRLCLDATVPAALLPPGPWQIGLTAVIETRAGEISYWALAHPDPKPDFHRHEAFCLSLSGNTINSSAATSRRRSREKPVLDLIGDGNPALRKATGFPPSRE